jgi:hypothetical protein
MVDDESADGAALAAALNNKCISVIAKNRGANFN